jgi:transglutaminase-like putative cysteine protease
MLATFIAVNSLFILPTQAGIARNTALARAATATQENYPDAEQVLVDSLLRVDYNADGTYTQTDESYIKILTEEARRGYQTISSYFTIPYQRGPEDCRIDLLEIIKPDGEVVTIDVEAQSRVMTNPGSMSQNIYNPNDRLIQVNVSGLEVGDVLHYIMFDRIVQPRMTNTWGDWITFESTSPILRKTVEVQAPADRPLRSMALLAPVSNTVEQVITTNETGILYRWTATDAPRMFPEPNMPPMHTVVQRQLISTVPEWETISRWYWNLSEPHLETTPAIQEKITELIDGTTSDQQKIENIFQFVSQQIRYMGITVEATAPGYEPHDVADTFTARHGVCRDKAALLVAMLRSAGFDAFPTLIHNGPKKDPEVPLPYFNHAIVAVRRADGSYQLMDPTDENTRQLLPAYLNDKSYLVATPEGDTLRTSPFIPASENMMHIRTEAALSAIGALTGSTRLSFDGINDNAYRGAFAGMKPEDRTRFINGVIKRALPDAVVDRISILPDDMTDVSTPLTITIDYHADNVLVNGRNSALLPLPLLGTSVGMVNFILGQTGLEKRKYPLMTEVACGVDEQIAVNIDPALGGIEVMPDYETVESSGIVWQGEDRFTNNTISLNLTFQLLKTEYTPQEYIDLKNTLRIIERDLRKMPVLSKPVSESTQPDSRIIDVLGDYRILDAQHWQQTRTVKREILTYAGKKKNAELKIAYNPAMESVKLNYARVTAPDGTVSEISDQEINIMDAAWAGSAPRYPAGKTLIASLPAVSVGSIIEFQLETTYSNRPFFAAHEMFRFFEPVECKRVKLNFKATDIPVIAHVLSDDITVREHEITDETGSATRVLEWSITNSPAVQREDMLPPWYSFNPAIFASLGTWSNYAADIHARLLVAATGQSAAQQRADKLIAQHETPAEKLRAIRDFIEINVRTAGPGLDDLPLSTITPADRTLADGYGNTTDKAILYYAMLRQAGFNPAFVLAGSTPYLPQLNAPYQTSPDPAFFPSVLVQLTNGLPDIPAGSAYYLNAGNQYAEPGASVFEGKTMLTLPAGNFRELVPSKPARTKNHYTVTPQLDGTVDLVLREELYGPAFASANQRFAEMPPEERRRYHQELIGDISQAAKKTSDLITDFSSYPGTIEYAVTIPDYATIAGDYVYFPLPTSLNNLFHLRTDERSNPLYYGSIRRAAAQVDVKLPAGTSVESRPETISRSGIADTDSSFSQDGGLVTQGQQRSFILNYTTDLSPAIIPVSDYPELLYINKQLSKVQNNILALKNRKNNE